MLEGRLSQAVLDHVVQACGQKLSGESLWVYFQPTCNLQEVLYSGSGISFSQSTLQNTDILVFSADVTRTF